MSDEVALHEITEQSEVILFFQWQNRVFGTYLGAHRTTYARILIYFNLLTIPLHGRTRQKIQTVTMAFTFVVIYIEGF